MDFVKVSINAPFDSIILLKICIFFSYFCRKSVGYDYLLFLTKKWVENLSQIELFEKFEQNPYFQFFMMFGQV